MKESTLIQMCFFFFLFYLIQTYKPLTKNGQVTLIGKGVEEEKKFCSLKLTARKVQGIVQLNQKIGTYDDSQPKLKDFYFSFQNSIKPFPMDNCQKLKQTDKSKYNAVVDSSHNIHWKKSDKRWGGEEGSTANPYLRFKQL